MLQDRVILVTGGASGIGAESCRQMAAEGAIVVLSDVNDEMGKQTAAEIGCDYQHLDVREESQWQQAIDAILAKHGRMDCLVNNAGIIGFGGTFGAQDPENIELKDWHAIHGVNLDGVVLGCKYAIKAMKNNKFAAIVNMASRSGHVGIPTAVAYASTKASIINYTKSVALYCASKGYNIICNAISPAVIITPLWDPMIGHGDDREKNIQALAAGVPLGRPGHPIDVARVVVFLASQQASYITGTDITIDGGIIAGAAAAPGK